MSLYQTFLYWLVIERGHMIKDAPDHFLEWASEFGLRVHNLDKLYREWWPA